MQLPEESKEFVVTVLQQCGICVDAVKELRETIRVDVGRPVLRTYRAQGYTAIWHVDLGIIQVFNPQGSPLRSVNLHVRTKPARLAA